MSTFTQKHYEKLAAFLNYELDVARAVNQTIPNAANFERVATICGMIRLLSNVLENDNPKFDLARFYRACGLDSQAIQRRAK